MTSLSKIEFEIIEGIFHDGLGTFAELMLANKLIEPARLDQPQFNLSNSEAKMRDAVNRRICIVLKVVCDDSQPSLFKMPSHSSGTRENIAGRLFTTVGDLAKDLFDEGK